MIYKYSPLKLYLNPATADVAPHNVSCVAVHGTGTPLGDPIEMGALGQALSCAPDSGTTKLTVASVKSCYGHTEGAAGLTGALLSLQLMGNQVKLSHLCLWLFKV